jgi:peptidoglycan-N-acetylglucosamine deacetylase
MKGFYRFFVLLFLMFLIACNQVVKHKENLNKETKVEEHKENDKKSVKLIRQILSLASKGMVRGSDIKLSDSIEEVYSMWGKPSKTDRYKEFYYDEYLNNGITFGYLKDGEVFDIRTYHKELGTITSSALFSELGKPSYSRIGNDESIYGYRLEDGIELKFIVSDSTGKVDHISVYHNVANQEIPNPSKAEEKYILDIKGTSEMLSETAWANMLKSRQDMKSLAEEHEGTVFLNGSNQRMVALTFDDGPDEEITSGIIDVLKTYHVRGSFFFVGEKVRQNQDVVKKAYQAGNLVLSHSYYHNDLSKKGMVEINNDLRMSSKAIEDVIGKTPVFFRPPYGATNEHVIAAAKEQNLKIVLWSIDTLDWSQKDSNNINKNVLMNVRNGDIILFHSDEDKEETLKALPSIISGLQEKGFQIVTIDKLLDVKAKNES